MYNFANNSQLYKHNNLLYLHVFLEHQTAGHEQADSGMHEAHCTCPTNY